MNARELEDLIIKVGRAERSKEKAQWERDKWLKELKDTYNCKSLAEAKTLIRKIEEEKKRVDDIVEKSLADFRKQWEGFL